MTALIMSCALENGLISRLLSHKFFVFLGEISFSFYLLHVLLITLSDQWIQKWLQTSSPVFEHIATTISTQTSLRIVLYVGLCIAISALFYLFYEQPMKKRIYRLLNRKHRSHNATLENSLSTHTNTPVAQKTPL
jgi:peptidoglycan/LPS O-acetylase OafA/YrhL